MLIGRDFNVRIGKEGSIVGQEDFRQRKSKDIKISNGGKKLLEVIGNKGWSILNGNIIGDEEGELHK